MTDLTKLTDAWKRTKAALSEAQEAHLQSEINLYNAVKEELPNKGTYHVGDITITCAFSEKWDQERLFDLNANWHEVANVPFPFKSELKPDGKQVGYIRDNMPTVYGKLSNCLTLTPKKPAFKLKGE